MLSAKQILIDAMAKTDANSQKPLRIDFKLTDENYHNFLRAADRIWYIKKETAAESYYAKKSKVLEDYASKFPGEKQTNFKTQKHRLIQLYIEECDDIPFDPTTDDQSRLTRDNLLLNAESSYIEAQKTCRYILEISKNENGRSSIQPELKYDPDQYRFYVEIPATSLPLLTKLLDNPPAVKETSWVTRQITSLIAPYTPDIHYQGIARGKTFYTNFINRYPYKDNESTLYATVKTRFSNRMKLAYSPLKLLTKDGVPLDGIEINQAEENSRAYIIHCHGNACFYWEDLSALTRLAAYTDCNVVSFDYRGYGLSQGQVKSKKDLYEDAFTYARHCVDQGAEYVLLDGFSLGGAVAAKVANKLAKYCKSTGKSVQIELFNAMSFSSTADMVHGAVKEVSILSIGERSKPGIFKTVLAGILSFIAKPILKLTNWLMEPRKEINKMREDSYEIISTKGDMVIGTYASMEYKLRDRAQEELFACETKIGNLKKEIDQIKKEIVALFNEERKRNSQTASQLKSYALETYTANDINLLNVENINLKKRVPGTTHHDYTRFDDNINKLINQLEKNELLLQREEINIKMKQSRLMWTRHTSRYKDSEAHVITNAHIDLHVKSDVFASGVDKQIAFAYTRPLRRDANSEDFVVQTQESKYSIDNALSLFTRSEPSNIPFQRNDKLPIKITSIETLALESERIQRVLSPRKYRSLGNILENIKNHINHHDFEDALKCLDHEYFAQNKILKHFKESAASFISVQQIATKFKN